MIRWTLFLIGVVSTALGVCFEIDARFLRSRAMGAIDVERARAIAAKGKECFVALSADLKGQKTAYRTGLSQPAFCGCPESEVRVIHASTEASRLESVLGCLVAFEGPARHHVLTLEASDRDHGRRVRLIAPLEGTGLRFWSLSNEIPFEDLDRQRRWTFGSRFVGRLTRFRDLSENQPGLQSGVAALRDSYLREFGDAIPDGAWVLLPPHVGSSSSGSRLVEVPDSEGAIFVDLGPDRKLSRASQAALSPSPVSGLLRPQPSKNLAGLAEVFGRLPAVVAVVEPMTVDEFFSRSGRREGRILALGVTLVGLSLLVFAVHAWKFRRERAQVEAEIEEEMEIRNRRRVDA